jgi:hypothetical protein
LFGCSGIGAIRAVGLSEHGNPNSVVGRFPHDKPVTADCMGSFKLDDSGWLVCLCRNRPWDAFLHLVVAVSAIVALGYYF